MESTRVLQFTGPRQVAVVPTRLRAPDQGEVVVRTLFSGISGGTELLAYRGELDPELPLDETLGALGGTFRHPFSYGYSCVGRVVKSRGSVPFGALVFAFHPHQEHCVVGEADVVVVDDHADPRTVTLFPLVETALQLALDAGQVQHERVVVLGLGCIGLLTALLLQRAGALVIGSEPEPWRREVAASLGVPTVAPQDLPSRVASQTGGRGVPLLVEVSGSPDVLGGALSLLAHEGTALVGSWYGSTPVTLPLGEAFHRRRLTLRSSQVSTVPSSLSGRWDVGRRRARARGLLAELPLAAVATTEFPFSDAAAAFEAADRRQRGVLHIALRYE
jgi:2-desacetyl-2-hydroxyethyl bacteriochlorophyllide A dehydrogenase